MPVYEYVCPECGVHNDMVTTPGAKPLCQRCKKLFGKRIRMERVWTPPATHFHGPNFVTVDLRADKGIRGKGSAVRHTGRYHPKARGAKGSR